MREGGQREEREEGEREKERGEREKEGGRKARRLVYTCHTQGRQDMK